MQKPTTSKIYETLVGSMTASQSYIKRYNCAV